ncbi:hypothetical protein [Streptomyces sp. NPDC007088]|uniref:hypothetical protein n=1 Tax=Streptomyces sp. NPDC007088 TaxID=3364773 RepID=UPI00367931E0
MTIDRQPQTRTRDLTIRGLAYGFLWPGVLDSSNLLAFPRALDKAEVRASEAARLYGRWERHSNARPYLAGMPPRQRQAHARDFRAAAFQVVIDTLLYPPNTVPQTQSGLPPWAQVYPLAAGIAHYYWFNPTAEANPDESARILAAADRRHATAAATPAQRGPAAA